MRKVKGKKSKHSSNDKTDKRPNCYNRVNKGHYKANHPKKEKNVKGRNSHFRR